MSEKQLQAGIFLRNLPHYRLGVFREVQRDDRISVTICAPENYKQEYLQTEHREKGFPFADIRVWRWRIPFTRRLLSLQPYAVWGLLRGKFDVVVLGNTFLDLHVWIDLLLCRLLGRSVCLWGHGDTLPPTKTSRVLRGIVLRLADAMVFYTESDRDQWIARGLRPEKLFVAYNAINTDEVSAIKARLTPDELAEFRREKGLVGKKVVIYIGRLFDYKKPDVVVRAMKRVVERVPQAHLVMIGDGPVRRSLEELAAELGLSEQVTLTGTIPEEETVAKYHLCSQVGVMPAQAGLSIQHAFGYGMPFIVGDYMAEHPPEVELVTEGVTGMFCRDGDPEDFARAIIEILSDDELRARMSANAVRLIEEKYNVQRMASGILDAIRYCAERRGRRKLTPGRSKS
ncbi:MAG: glycosyltransferase family 4 protein [Planctomycetes bacterium]|nr:glycosyltransferase family 4 protein [Planctomycetota bacterium]